VLDFFVTVPGLGHGGPHADMEEIDVVFEGSSRQLFRIGAASVAVPGTPLGLETAHSAAGTLPWRELVQPAIELARDGFELTRPQGYLHAILDSILRHTAEGAAMYGRDGNRLVAGDTVRMPELAGTLEAIGRHGAGALYRGKVGRALCEHVRAGGGDLTRRDLQQYRAIWRRPVRSPFRGYEFVSNPPPSAGGVLIGLGLRLLERLPGRPAPGTAEAIARLIEVMREQSRARERSLAHELRRGGLDRRLSSEEYMRAAAERIRQRLPGGTEAAAPGGTTHISVVDGEGNAASLSASLGSGSGLIVPDTGIHLNNMLGEYDRVRTSTRAGHRLTSLMSPSIALKNGRVRLAVGSAGSIRLRGAILQVATNVLEHGLAVEEAIAAPRIHLEEPVVHCEGGNEPAELDRLEESGYELARWRRRNLYFGGAAAVGVSGSRYEAAGDPRRGGHGIVVG
jgi:gamma-glutamyltranspeptidase/glutathione hydrolase